MARITVVAGSVTNWSKRHKYGKNLESTWNSTSKFLMWTQIVPSSNPRSRNSPLWPRLWTASGTPCRGPTQRYQVPGNNYVTPPQLSISIHASRENFFPRNSRNRFGITYKQSGNEPLIWLNTCNVEQIATNSQELPWEDSLERSSTDSSSSQLLLVK